MSSPQKPRQRPDQVASRPPEAERLYKTESIVLKQVHIGEADRLLTLYTPYLGKLRVVARGVRRPKSKLAGHVEPLVHTRLMIAKGRTLDIVTQAETVTPFVKLRSGLETTARGIYCAELVDAFAPDEAPNPQAFALLVVTLGHLDEGEPDIALRWFELHLLNLMGFRPEFHQCAECGGALPLEAAAFSPEAGGILCPGCRQIAGSAEHASALAMLSLNDIKALRFIQDQQYTEARRLRLAAPLAREIEDVLRLYVRHLLERDLRSTAFVDHLRRVSPA
ncbi:MAG: DNA repair protein RecO [Dehalococcoidia bacterium]|nr:DNA repair protein RecO [Dehalococcoidia bacterium]